MSSSSYDSYAGLVKLVDFVRDELAYRFPGVVYDVLSDDEIETKTDEIIDYVRHMITVAFDLEVVSPELDFAIDEGIFYTLAGGHLTDRDRVLDLAELLGAE
jgi:hypothetical protein